MVPGFFFARDSAVAACAPAADESAPQRSLAPCRIIILTRQAASPARNGIPTYSGSSTTTARRTCTRSIAQDETSDESRSLDASNRDWEDIASFTLDGVAYLLIADIGDNDGKRKDVRLYVVEEPKPGKSKVDYAWRLDFEYPEGARDAEAIAVDVENRQVLVLTKRDIPALLYSVPLVPESKKRQTATRLGAVGSLPQPTRSEIEFAAKTDSWHWQPTSMDISDGRDAGCRSDLRWRLPV